MGSVQSLSRLVERHFLPSVSSYNKDLRAISADAVVGRQPMSSSSMVTPLICNIAQADNQSLGSWLHLKDLTHPSNPSSCTSSAVGEN
jgi:hypothetical protein